MLKKVRSKTVVRVKMSLVFCGINRSKRCKIATFSDLAYLASYILGQLFMYVCCVNRQIL